MALKQLSTTSRVSTQEMDLERRKIRAEWSAKERMERRREAQSRQLELLGILLPSLGGLCRSA